MDWVRVPKVTAYLLVGLAVGHHGLNLVSPEAMHHLEPFANMAMALVLFNLGAQFPLSKLSRLRRLSPLLAGEQLATFIVVTAGVYLFSSNVAMAVLLGTLALATAPATTVLVLKEIQSRGPVTELANGLVVLNNLVCILLFESLLLILISDEQTGPWCLRKPGGQVRVSSYPRFCDGHCCFRTSADFSRPRSG